ncbi:ABC transporter ATP-binding protein [Arenibaculum sp.]|uniref:ABC transporter ATP-binding protein n=1 Tax=Arenibaculum sp. TaxID=2865862 RepID=UPI002E137526|nr:ABC transporter ATP-binding protein [Arenibaculum sp.]
MNRGLELTVAGLSHSYGDLRVLDGIDLTVREGELVALIGPSGCGKSTLLSIMGGILRPETGSVLLGGRVPEGCLNPLTYVFQDFALLPWRTVRGNVALVLEHHALSRDERRAMVDDVLRRTGLLDFAEALPRQLSGGMRQRVGIARALVVRPAVLLMDEPLSALDAQTRELLMEDLVSLWLRERVTGVYVTHNLAEALRLADRIVVLSRRPGRIRDVVPVAIPQAERTRPVAQGELAALNERLWHLIKAEAQVAEREVIDD